MVICLFYSDISAQILRDRSYLSPDEPSAPLGDCGNVADFTLTVSPCRVVCSDVPTTFFRRTTWDMGIPGSTLNIPFSTQTGTDFNYGQSGNFTITHTVFLPDGTPCPSSKTVAINCPPCPQILDINVTDNGYLPTTVERVCSPQGFVGGGNDLPEINRCVYKFTPVLNTNNTSGLIFNWETWIEDEAGNPFSNCSKSAIPDFFVANNKGTGSYFIRVQLKVNASNCSGTQTKSKRIHLNQPLSCYYDVVQFRPTGSDTNNESFFSMRKSSTTNDIQFYPNPVDNLLHVSNLKDSEDYTFEIHNTLGQTVLTQKVSSIDTSINLTDLETGIYIGIVKSQGKIISTEKIYKK